MILGYTIGSTKSYNEAFLTDPNIKKVGKSENYDGGWIWKTQEDASNFLNSIEFLKIDWGDNQSRDPHNFSIYGVIINSWEDDTYLNEKDHQLHLLTDAVLVKL